MTDIEIRDWRPLRKGDSLQGFLTLLLPSGMTLHDCSCHQRVDGAHWISLPARQYTKSDGTVAWARIVDFADKAAHQRFQKSAREAVDKYFAEHPAESTAAKRSVDSTMITDADVSF